MLERKERKKELNYITILYVFYFDSLKNSNTVKQVTFPALGHHHIVFYEAALHTKAIGSIYRLDL